MAKDALRFYRFLSQRFRPVNERLIFVVMPFAPTLLWRYQRLFKEPLSAEGFEVRRADEIYGTAELISNIVTSLQEAALVIVDLTGRNPNVLYELGLANGFGKNVLLVASHEADIPADLRHLTYCVIDDSTPERTTSLVLDNVHAMLGRSQPLLPITDVQRILEYSVALGVTDIVPADETFAFQMMLSATKSIDIVLMAGRTFSSTHVRNLGSELTQQFQAISPRALLVHPSNPYCESYYDAIDGGGVGSNATQVETGYRRLLQFGIRPRFHRDFIPWGGVLIDGQRAAIQFVYPDEWQTFFLVLEARLGGLFHAFQTTFAQVYERSSVKDW